MTRQKNDITDAEASGQAAHDALCFGEQRGDPRRGNGLSRSAALIRQRMPAITALCDHLAAFGQIVPEPDAALPADAIPRPRALIAALAHLAAKIARRAKANVVARLLMTVPGIGSLIATALAVLAPPPETFRNARDCAAWLGLGPRAAAVSDANRVIINRRVHAAAGHLAGRNAIAQATIAGARRAGQQDGTYCLNLDGKGPGPSSAGGDGISRALVARASKRKGTRSSSAQRS